MSEYEIRPAVEGDLPALSAFSRRTFTETFIDGFGIPYPADDLERFFVKSFGVDALRERINDKDAVFWLAVRDGQILALCHAGPNDLPHEEAQAGEMELRRLYVGKEAQGLGLGTELLKRALDWMQERTTGALWIGVWSGNLKAQKLYQAYGFEKVGGYGYAVGDWIDQEYILRRKLG